MSGAFVNQLRARGDVIQMAAPGAPSITVRVEVPEVWEIVRIAVSPDASIQALKTRAIAAAYPAEGDPAELVMKLRGFEVFDESASLASTGAVDGSTFLLTHRRRRPVR